METLEPLRSPSGHDAYCHVCWGPVYRFWVAKESPDYARCGIGDFTAQTCPNSTGPARQKAAIARLKASGLWRGSLGVSLAEEAKTANTVGVDPLQGRNETDAPLSSSPIDDRIAPAAIDNPMETLGTEGGE